MLPTKVHRNRSTGSKQEDFKAFYHIWAWKPSGDQYYVNIFSFLCTSKLRYKNLVKKGQVVSETRGPMVL